MRFWVMLIFGCIASFMTSAYIFAGFAQDANANGAGQPNSQPEIQFLRFGRPLSDQPATFSRDDMQKYENAIRRPNGPTQCANRNASGAIDVSKGLNWNNVRNTRDIEICIFFAAAELQDVEKTDDFLSASGFGSIDRIPETPGVTRFSNIDGYGLIMNGGMFIERVPFRIKGIMGALLAYSLTISVSLDEAGRPYGSHSNLNTL